MPPVMIPQIPSSADPEEIFEILSDGSPGRSAGPTRDFLTLLRQQGAPVESGAEGSEDDGCIEFAV
jgi:hypothetical protein